MRLRRLKVRDFLSLKNVEFTFERANSTVLVGPNGAGKSNVIRALTVVHAAMRSAATGGDFFSSLRLGAVKTSDMEIRVGVSFDAAEEQELIATFLQAALCSQAMLSPEHPHDPEREIPWIQENVRPAALQDLFEGDIILRAPGDDYSRFSLLYEFLSRSELHTVVFQHPIHSDSAIIAAAASRLNQRLSIQAAIEALRYRKAFPLAGFDQEFEFKRDLLPASAEGIHLELGDWIQPPLPQSLADFTRTFGINLMQNRRRFRLSDVIAKILDDSLVVIDDSRSLPRRTYDHAEITASPSLANPRDHQDIGLYLFQMKNGDLASRKSLSAINKFLESFTGYLVDAALGEPDAADSPERAAIDLFVERGDIQIDLRFAGAGVLELLILSRHLIDATGKVLVLDEPGRNLHPSLQRRLMEVLRDSGAQLLLATHSPNFVPADSSGLRSVFRLEYVGGETKFHAFSSNAELPGRFFSIDLAATTHVRQLLFAQAVILVEGETDLGALSIWFDKAAEANHERLLDELNVSMILVGGDGGFQRFSRFLDAFAIPWAVICDGDSLKKKRVVADLAKNPAVLDFDVVKSAARSRGIFTLASDWDESIEATLESAVGSAEFAAIQRSVRKNKIMAGIEVAQVAPPPPSVRALRKELLDYVFP